MYVHISAKHKVSVINALTGTAVHRWHQWWTMTTIINDDTNDDANDTQQTNHDCIGSLACMPNEPKSGESRDNRTLFFVLALNKSTTWGSIVIKLTYSLNNNFTWSCKEHFIPHHLKIILPYTRLSTCGTSETNSTTSSVVVVVLKGDQCSLVICNLGLWRGLKWPFTVNGTLYKKGCRTSTRVRWQLDTAQWRSQRA